jgi:hypothetical protein
MECTNNGGHRIIDSELMKQDGIVFVRWRCGECGEFSDWLTVGEAPEPEKGWSRYEE